MLVILIPTISGVSRLEKSVAKYFVKNGLDVVIPVSFEKPFAFDENTVKAMDAGFWRPVAQTKLMVEELRQMNEFDYKKTFLVGGSQGGIRTTMLLGQGLNIDKAYTFAAGGDFPRLYAETTVNQLVSFRENHMRALDIPTVDLYESYLRENLQNDPMKSCAKRSADMRMVIATKDTSVPTSTQNALWEACGNLKSSM